MTNGRNSSSQLKAKPALNRRLIIISAIAAAVFSAGGILGWLSAEPSSIGSPNENSGRTSLGTHYAYSASKLFYNEAFDQVETNSETDSSSIQGLIVNHHLLAKQLIARGLQAVSSTEPRTVVLLSPNHFNVGRGQLTTSKYDWQTPYGVLQSDQSLTDNLVSRAGLTVEEPPCENEHGVVNLVAFIKRSLPNSSIVPVLVKDGLTDQAADEFAERLAAAAPDALIVASLDWSHTLPPLTADFHDVTSRAAVAAADLSAVGSLDVDSRPALRILLQVMKARGAEFFKELAHFNSTELLDNASLTDTTSYIVGAFTMGEAQPTGDVTLFSLGDVMLDRYIRQAIDRNSAAYPFENVTRLLSGTDLLIANLEGPITDSAPQPLEPNNLVFTFDPEVIPALAKLGFGAFSLANNHTDNYGKAGFQETKSRLTEAGIASFGDYFNQDELSTVQTVRGRRIGLVGYNGLKSGLDNVLSEIERLRPEVDKLIVFSHWGSEYQSDFNSTQQTAAHAFVDHGADLVLGAHPHVIQPLEVYKDKAIFYSLGNFIFDQTFSEETQQGLGVGIVFGSAKTTFTLAPVGMASLQATLLTGAERDKILNSLADDSAVPDGLRESIRLGFFSL